ncbi:MAG: ParB/RepB/Spo0J family partition protein [Hyphomicrobiales bacterium]
MIDNSEGLLMAEDASKRRLGRGLAALMGDAVPEAVAVDTARGARRLPIEQISPNPRNPRGIFEESALDDLANSIREKGVVQPLLVRTLDEGSFELIAGERRWRAAQRAGLDTVPVIVREVDDKESLELAIIENVQRSDLNALEEALGYQQLVDAFNYKQKELATVIGKSRSHIANTLRLLKLPDGVQTYLSSGALSAGHARQLIDREDAPELARRIIDEGLSVRDVERIVQRDAQKADAEAASQNDGPLSSSTTSIADADTRAIEAQLAELLGLSVKLNARKDGSGKLSIQYHTLEQLDDLLRRMGSTQV